MEPVSGDSSRSPGRSPESPRSCARFRERLQDALDERAGLETLRRDLHLEGCVDCLSELEALASLDQLMTAEPAAEPPPGLSAAVLRSIERDATVSRRRARATVAGALAAAVLVGVGLDVYGGALEASFNGFFDDARALAHAANVRADQLMDVRGIQDGTLPSLPSLRALELPAVPGVSGSLATLALGLAATLAAGEVVWWRRARRAGGEA